MACYRASVNQAYNSKGSLQNVYPPPPVYNPGCPINLDYDTLPSGYPMKERTLGPNSLKHLYRGAWYYPPQKITIPEGTMYEYNSEVKGPFNTRVSYGSKMYPYQHRHPREISEYSEGFIPLPNQFAWTIHTTVSDGAWGK